VKRGKEVQAPVIPASAVLEDKDGQYVFTVDSTNKAIQTRIKTSEQVGTNLVVTSGLKAGDIVITEGIQRVRTGITVSPQPAAAAGAADPAAKPASGASGN
jgi:membrane fusion protein (multidrug efflux system)